MGEKIKLNSTTRVRGRLYLIRDGRGMGGAGSPAGHYANAWVVAQGQDRGNGYQSYMAVDYALAQEWVPAEAKALIRKRLGIKPDKKGLTFG